MRVRIKLGRKEIKALRRDLKHYLQNNRGKVKCEIWVGDGEADALSGDDVAIDGIYVQDDLLSMWPEDVIPAETKLFYIKETKCS